MGGLIGTATSEKNGLMPKTQTHRSINKNNGEYCCLILDIKNPGEIFSGTLVITNVNGDVSVISVSAARWNANRVYCKLINGIKDNGISLLYTIEENSVLLYIMKIGYARVEFSPYSPLWGSSLTIVDSIPSNAINIDF